MTISLFPGQGVQAPGMDGSLSSEVPEVFAAASRVLSIDVTELCRTGRSGEATLDSTRWAQPAVLTCSVAAARVLANRGVAIEAAAGHSIGEYAALVACASLEVEDAVSLVALRARATSQAAAATPGGMAAILRLDEAVVRQICEDAGVALAAANAPGQCVISGTNEQLETALRLAADAKGRCMRLDVDGAFHSPVMSAAQGPLREALETTSIAPPSVPFWSATTATRLDDPDDIRRALVDQLVATVRWQQTITNAAQKHPGPMTDMGPGHVVGALARRILGDVEIRYVDDLVASTANAS